MKNLSKSNVIRPGDAERVSAYELRDMTRPGQPGRAKPKAQQPAMTAANLEKIQQQARQEAFEQGKQEGFEYGHKEAVEQYRQQISEKLSQFDQLMQCLHQPFQDLDEQVENEIVELVISMVRQLVRREVKMDPNHIVGVVREAMSVLPVARREVTLTLNPEDAGIIREVYAIGETEQSWHIIEDPVLNRGGCRVTADDSVIDATLESRLDALIAPLINDERSREAGDD